MQDPIYAEIENLTRLQAGKALEKMNKFHISSQRQEKKVYSKMARYSNLVSQWFTTIRWVTFKILKNQATLRIYRFPLVTREILTIKRSMGVTHKTSMGNA